MTAVKADSDVSATDGLTTSLLLFGALSSIHTKYGVQTKKPDHLYRQQSECEATEDMEVEIVKDRINRALKHAASPAAKEHFQGEDIGLVWRVNIISNHIGEWFGPYSVTNVGYDPRLLGFLSTIRRLTSHRLNDTVAPKSC